MTEKTSCTCGANQPKRIIFPCAGQANVGQITNLAAIRLTEDGYGNISCSALLAIGAENLMNNVKNADEIVVLDGCPMLCAKKIAEAHNVKIGQYLVLTEMGIEKGPSRKYTEDDIGKVVSACWKGEGRDGNAAPCLSKPGSGGCGCGGH